MNFKKKKNNNKNTKNTNNKKLKKIPKKSKQEANMQLLCTKYEFKVVALAAGLHRLHHFTPSITCASLLTYSALLGLLWCCFSHFVCYSFCSLFGCFLFLRCHKMQLFNTYLLCLCNSLLSSVSWVSPLFFFVMSNFCFRWLLISIVIQVICFMCARARAFVYVCVRKCAPLHFPHISL